MIGVGEDGVEAMHASDQSLSEGREAMNAPGEPRSEEIGHEADIFVGGIDVTRVMAGEFAYESDAAGEHRVKLRLAALHPEAAASAWDRVGAQGAISSVTSRGAGPDAAAGMFWPKRGSAATRIAIGISREVFIGSSTAPSGLR